MGALWTRSVDFFLYQEGSTRPAALMRIGLVALIWTRFAKEFLFYRNLAPYSVVLSTALFLGTTLMFFGLWTRFASVLTGCTLMSFYYYLGFGKGVEPFTHHHTYVLGISACLLALSPCGQSYSWDRWNALNKAEAAGTPPPTEQGPQWAIRLIAMQVSLIYFWSAWDKVNPGFLTGERLEHITMYLYLGSDYPKSPLFHPIMVFLAWSTVLLELVLAFGLWFRPALRWLIPIGMGFHAILYVFLPVGTYSLNMWLLYLAFLDPEAVHRMMDRLSGVPSRPNAA